METEPAKFKLVHKQPDKDLKQINSIATHHVKMQTAENVFRESMVHENPSPKPLINS